MQRFSTYIKKYHSNLEKEFHKMDKDGSGMLSTQELRAGFEKFGGSTSDESWQFFLSNIDVDGSGDVELAEMIDTFRRWSSGGWEAVRNQQGHSIMDRKAMYDDEVLHRKWGLPNTEALQVDSVLRKRQEYTKKLDRRREQRPLRMYDHQRVYGSSILLTPVTPRASKSVADPAPHLKPQRHAASSVKGTPRRLKGRPQTTQQQRSRRLSRGLGAAAERPIKAWSEYE